MNARLLWTVVAWWTGVTTAVAFGQQTAESAPQYQALKCAAPTIGTTWAVLDRDGANRPVERYLSSLGQGESGTGMVTSPPFVVTGNAITFTICGHDGQAGGRGDNYIALVDARKGQTLLKTPPPQNDAMQERTWDVSKYRGTEVRIEVHDGNPGGAFAWLGVGRIDAGDALRVDFREGIPDGWDRPERTAEIRYELLTGGIPFQRPTGVFSLMPARGTADLPCGFAAQRLFFLGCTVAGGRPLKSYGSVQIHYADGSAEAYPLLGGFTLDAQYKRLSPSTALHLRPSADPYQYYFVIAPRPDKIEKIRLVASTSDGPTPRITAVTCETEDDSDHLLPLPPTTLEANDADWIEKHTLSPGRPELAPILEQIRRDHKLSR